MHQRSNTIASPLTLNLARHTYSPSPSPRPDSRVATQSPDHPQHSLNLAQIEQVRMLILGMEQRLQVREEKLVKTVERAEDEGRRFEALRSEIISDTWFRRLQFRTIYSEATTTTTIPFDEATFLSWSITSHDQSGPEHDYPVNNGDGEILTSIYLPVVGTDKERIFFVLILHLYNRDSALIVFVVFSTYHSLIPSCLNCPMFFIFIFIFLKKSNTFRTMFPEIPPAHTQQKKKIYRWLINKKKWKKRMGKM